MKWLSGLSSLPTAISVRRRLKGLPGFETENEKYLFCTSFLFFSEIFISAFFKKKITRRDSETKVEHWRGNSPTKNTM